LYFGGYGMTEKEQREMIEAAIRHNVDQQFLVANNSVQGWSVCGYADLTTAWELACSLAKEAVKWAYPHVYVVDRVALICADLEICAIRSQTESRVVNPD
jgi:hypothetical protein